MGLIYCIELSSWHLKSPATQLFLQQFFFKTLRPRQNGRHCANDTFKTIFMNEDVWNFIEISLKFVPKGPIDNIPAFVWIMAWRRPGAKPLSEPMVVRLPTHICVTGPQWVKAGIFVSGIYLRLLTSLVVLSSNTVSCISPWNCTPGHSGYSLTYLYKRSPLLTTL